MGVSPAVSNRDARVLPRPRALRPRPLPRRAARRTAQPFAWIPFGAGRHRCVGAAFAMMQLKAIFSMLLRELRRSSSRSRPRRYRNDHSKMVVQLAQPCRVRYRRRDVGGGAREDRGRSDLCQGHAACVRRRPRCSSSTPPRARSSAEGAPPTESQRAAAKRAIKYCPTRASAPSDAGHPTGGLSPCPHSPAPSSRR